MNELEEFADQIEKAAERSLQVRFNPLAFTMEEVNEMIRKGYEPLPPHMWWLTDKRRQQQIDAGERPDLPRGC